MKTSPMEAGELNNDPPVSDAHYRLLVEAVSDCAIFMLDPTGVVTSWNTGAQRLKGYTPAQIIGQHFSRFYTDEDRKAGVPQEVLATAAARRFAADGWRVRSDGTLFWAHVMIDPIRSPEGRLLGFAKVTRDLTEHKRAEEALRRSEQQLRLLVQGVTDYAIFMLDPQGLISNWNSGAQRIKGWAPEEVVGSHFSRFYTQEDRALDLPDTGLATASREGRFETEGWRVRKDGSRFWASVVIDAIRDQSGTLVGFAKVTRDITERRAAQRALDEARVSLFQSQKLEAIGQLTGGVAHDFNNLLTAVLGSLELLRKRLPAEPKILRLLDNAVAGAQRGAALTQRMLTFARRQELHAQPVDVPALVTGMIELLEHSLTAGVTIKTHFPEGLPKAFTDPHQLETAVLNLTINARDAMPTGGTIVIAGCEEDVRDPARRLKLGRYLRLSVADSGCGMDESTLARAPEPFFTTKVLGKGTGLGLSMVHGLAEQSGGRLELRSRENEGTVAELWLPVAADGTPAAPSRTEPDATPPLAARSAPLAIVAVDDDPLALTSVVAMLEDLGHFVLPAASGPEALAILRGATDKIDLLVTDYAMPHMTGLQLAEAVAAEWSGLPVLITTAYVKLPPGKTLDLPRINKPFGRDELARAVDALVTRDGQELAHASL